MNKTLVNEKRYNATKLLGCLFDDEKKNMACMYVDAWDCLNTDDNYMDFIIDVIIDGFELDK